MDDISVINLILEAGVVVKLVMIILMLASLVSWIVIIERWNFFRNLKSINDGFLKRFWSGEDLNILYAEVSSDEFQSYGSLRVFKSAFKEFDQLNTDNKIDELDLEGINRSMRVAIAADDEEMSKNLAFLANVGSVSPYIGLFGTVWGIMTAFQGLSDATQATINAVAPGISEALVATAMANVKMLNGYLEAEIVAARVGASKMGFFVSNDGDGYVGDGEFEDTFNPTTNAQAGVCEQLPAGMDFKAFDPTHPTSAFDSFTTSVLRSIASGLNISYHSLSNDLTSVNYSSIRQGALEDRSMYQIYQQFVIEHFVNPVFQSWLEMAISTGYINLPIGKFNKFAKAINFIPRSFAWIDPLKEMQANVIGLQNVTLTYSDISASYGRDTEELFEQHQKEIELAKQYDIELAYQPFGQKLPVEAKIQGGEEEEDA